MTREFDLPPGTPNSSTGIATVDLGDGAEFEAAYLEVRSPDYEARAMVRVAARAASDELLAPLNPLTAQEGARVELPLSILPNPVIDRGEAGTDVWVGGKTISFAADKINAGGGNLKPDEHLSVSLSYVFHVSPSGEVSFRQSRDSYIVGGEYSHRSYIFSGDSTFLLEGVTAQFPTSEQLGDPATPRQLVLTRTSPSSLASVPTPPAAR